MAAAILPDTLWDLVEPFLPIPPRRPQGGRPRVSDRACLSGIPWQMLPQELGCGSGMTCWRRLRDWQLAGVWDLIHFALLDWLARATTRSIGRARSWTVVPSPRCTAVTRPVRIPPIGPSEGARGIDSLVVRFGAASRRLV